MGAMEGSGVVQSAYEAQRVCVLASRRACEHAQRELSKVAIQFHEQNSNQGNKLLYDSYTYR